MELKYIGDIRLNENVMLSDPCYCMNTWCQIPINPDTTKNDYKMKPGRYSCYVTEYEDGRVSGLYVFYHNKPEYISCDNDNWKKLDGEVGVDSGLAGIYDYDYFKKHHHDKEAVKEWYHKFIDNISNLFYIDNNMIVTESGYGDGAYNAYAQFLDEDTIVALNIMF